MRKIQNVRGVLLRVASLGLVIGLALTATQAYGHSGGRHGGHHGYGYYGSYYGGHYRYSYGRYRYGYSPYRYGGRYRYSYGRRYGYYPYRSGGRYHGGLVHGLLSVPSAVVGSLFGYRHSPGYRGGAYGNHSTPPPATAPGGNGAPSSGGAYGGNSTTPPTGPGGNAVPPSGGGYGGNASTPPTTGPDHSGASRNSSPGTLDGGGWARLAEGRYSQALLIFAAEASNRPNAGRPKVGYALSTPAGGDLRRGVWAMRRAVGVDPKSIHYMTLDEPLRSRVAQLITRYRDNDGRAVSNAEAAFMLASLHYLLGDTDSARTAIDRAIADGDRSSGTGNLKRLIDTDPVPDTQRERRADPRPSADGILRSAGVY